jgi:hypothetical protein
MTDNNAAVVNNWAAGVTVDTKPEIKLGDDFINYNKSYGTIQVVNFGWGDNTNINLHPGDNPGPTFAKADEHMTYITYDRPNSSINIPMPVSLRVIDWMHKNSNQDLGDLTVIDNHEHMSLRFPNCRISNPEGMEYNSSSTITLNVTGAGCELVPLG